MIWALIILALWVALLAPGAVRWFRNHQPTTSVASFHRQLRLLEHSGPKIVEPAYRLGGETVEAAPVREAAPRTPTVPRLVLLTAGPAEKESTMRYGDRYGTGPEDRYEEEAWDDPWGAEDPQAAYEPPSRAQRTVRAPRAVDYDRYDDEYDDEYYDDVPRTAVAGLEPERASQRRHRILMVLGATIAATFVLGLLPGLQVLWVVTFLSIMSTVGYLALMLYASNTGLYGRHAAQPTHARRSRGREGQPIARVVIPAFPVDTADEDDFEDYDDDWGTGRVAAAR